MKQIFKRSLSVFLAIAIIFSSSAVGLNELDFSGLFAVRAKGVSIDNLTFTLNDDGKSYSVTHANVMASGACVVPDIYNGLPVTRIGLAAFSHCGFTSITIPDTIVSIDEEAFYSCSCLTSFIIPDGVKSIGNRAFEYCGILTSITIPDSVTSIGERVLNETRYYNDRSNWENDVLYTGNHLIEAEYTLSGEYTIKNGTKSIADGAFGFCESLTSVKIPDSVTSIGEGAFGYCERLTSVKIPDSVTSIGDGAFFECTSLDIINIPDSVTSIGNETFNGCEKLTSIVIPEGVTEIGEFAFFGCESLTSITIPDSVTYIGAYAFTFCNIASVYLNDVAAWCNIDFADDGSELLDSNPLYYARNLYVKGKLTKDIVIPDCTTKISDFAFCSCEMITSVVIPDSVTRIGQSAFYDCQNLEYTFYKGTKEEWSNIEFGSNNSIVLNVWRLHYETSAHTASDWIVKDATVDGVGEQYKVCTQCGIELETETIPQLKCNKAKLSKISNTSSGVKITWGKVSGADSYRVYRKTKGGSWNNIGSTSKTNFTDKTAKSGTTYYYAVKVRNEAGDTDYSNSLSIKRLSDPKLSSASNTSSGVKVSWKKVTGASGYIVYRKTKNGDWKEIGKTSKLYYTDKKAKSGTSYYYSVCAYSGSSKSNYDTDGLGIRRLVAPKISSATSKSEGILLKWNKITGASGYYVYRKASSGEWKRIATVKGNTKIKYLDESPRKGATYQYRVKAYYSKSTSYNSNTYKIKCKY